MDKAKQLRSELIAHIQSEATKAIGEDSSEVMSPEESSLFENRIRLFLEQDSSEYEKSLRVALNEVYSTSRETSDFWSPTLDVEEQKLNSEADTNR